MLYWLYLFSSSTLVFLQIYLIWSQDFNKFLQAIETEELYQFLKLAPPKKADDNKQVCIKGFEFIFVIFKVLFNETWKSLDVYEEKKLSE